MYLFLGTRIYGQWCRDAFESGAGDEAPEFFAVPLLFFGSKSSTISRFGERFRDGQYSLVSLLFAVLLLTVPPFLMEWAPVYMGVRYIRWMSVQC